MSQFDRINLAGPSSANTSHVQNPPISDIELLKLYQERFGGTFPQPTKPNRSNSQENGRGDPLAYPGFNSDPSGGDGGGSGFPGGHGGPGGPFLGHNQNENRGLLFRGANMKLPKFKEGDDAKIFMITFEKLLRTATNEKRPYSF